MINLDHVKFYSGANSFKNIAKYSGSASFPTSAAAGTITVTNHNFGLPSAPVQSLLLCNFLEVVEAIATYGSAAGTTPKRWYSTVVGGTASVGVHVNAPAPRVGWLSGYIYPVINGTTLTVTTVLVNPYADAITLDALTVPFTFVDYALAS